MLNILIALFIFFNIFFMIGVIKKDFSIIDIAWGLSFLLTFLVAAFNSSFAITFRIQLIGLLVSIWAIRLSGYIFYRSVKKGKEDFRYAQWRKEWGDKVNQKAYVRVFMLQLALSFFIATPLILIFQYPDKNLSINIFDIVGCTLWLVGFLFEAIGDFQKNSFKAIEGNENKFCNIGLWKYTRHPNYFGEALLWWGIWFITLNIAPFYFTIWAPVFLNYLLINVSGVAMLEKSYEKREGFLEYKNSTNRFIPWFKRSK